MNQRSSLPQIIAFTFLVCFGIWMVADLVQATGTSYTLVGQGNGAQTGTCTTSAVTLVTVTADSFTVAHTGLQDDGATASASGDYLVIMNVYTPSGTVAMDASTAAGKKLLVPAGAAWLVSGQDVPVGANGRQIQIQCIGHGATFTAKREQ